MASVDIDHETAAFDAVNVLIEAGHRDIAMISGTLQDPANGFARYQGYKRALETAGIPVRDEYVRIGNYRYESSVDAVNYFLELSPDHLRFSLQRMKWPLVLSIPFKIMVFVFLKISL